MPRKNAVFAIYRDRMHVEEGIDALLDNGFRIEDISVVLPEIQGATDFAASKSIRSPSGAGAVTGAVVGGTLGLLAGVATLSVPGLGPILAAGPIMEALAGTGAGLIGALESLAIPQDEAGQYEGMIRDGKVLLSVLCDNSDLVRRAGDVLEQTGARNIASTGGWRAGGGAGY
jgi:hypothetical protein